jgi:integrase
MGARHGDCGCWTCNRGERPKRPTLGPSLAVEDRRLSRNPCADVKPPRRQHRPRGCLSHDQVELLACQISPYGSVVRLLAYTGLRWGEMAALRVDSFDMLRRRVNVRDADAEVKGRIVWSNPNRMSVDRSSACRHFVREPLRLRYVDSWQQFPASRG